VGIIVDPDPFLQIGSGCAWGFLPHLLKLCYLVRGEMAGAELLGVGGGLNEPG
jgi:hypothetical protein